MTDDKGLIFLHIPKAAGSTLRSIIDRHYPQQVIYKLYGPQTLIDTFINLPEESRNRIRVLQGHIPFGLHKYLNVPVNYLTMLRDPVERVISFYYWILENREESLYEIVRGMSLSNFADSGFPITSNYQTRLISGSMEDSSDALAIAKHNLELPNTIFGLSERFDESLILFRNLLGWKSVVYARYNVTKNKPEKRDISDSIIETIKRHNRSDIELYQFAKQRFDENISRQGAGFQAEARKLHRLSTVYGTWTKGLNSLRRVTPDPVRGVIRKGLRVIRKG